MSTEKAAKAAQSNAIRQAAYRARKKAAQLQEIRGIYATEDQTKKIKEFAESLNKI